MEIKRCKICLELTIKAPERLNVIVWCLLTLNMFHTFFNASLLTLSKYFFTGLFLVPLLLTWYALNF